MLRPSSGEEPVADECGAFVAPDSVFTYLLLMPVPPPGLRILADLKKSWLTRHPVA